MNDPAVWGPIAIAVVVWFAGFSITNEIREFRNQRKSEHDEIILRLQAIEDEMTWLKSSVEGLEAHFLPSPETYD